MSTARRVGLWLGPIAAVVMLLAIDLVPGHPETTRMAAIAIWMAVWWITEAVPLGVTALLPVALYPPLGIMSGRQVAPLYFNSIIFLFLGGFLVALAMERWGLHRRIALRILGLVGGGPCRLVLAFLVAPAALSMWISNTATTMMMVPIAAAVIGGGTTTASDRDAQAGTEPASGPGPDSPGGFAPALLLATAYGASIGGLATLVGTPPNPLLVRNLALLFPAAPEISFAQWFVFALPLSLVLLLAAWVVLMAVFGLRRSQPPAGAGRLAEERARLGPPSQAERFVAAVFILMAVLWLTRAGLDLGDRSLPGWASLFAHGELIDDGTVAVAVALLLFVLPATWQPGAPRLMDWPTARRLPWGIVLLFGGGFALAQGFVDSGLAAWLGGCMGGLAGLPVVLIILSVSLIMTFLTELTSNTATAQMALPILASVAVALHVHPLLLLVPATLSASCAFMLPVATPPNAIIFGTGRLRVAQMARAGIVLNLVGAVLITAGILLLGRLLSIDPGSYPAWATTTG
jgi:sodium-dependent dicarboxylate transporter 2/3/5